MKYTIKEILPVQINVEFEDGSWAVVPIGPEATLDEIDHAVSQYDPDFLPDPETLINQNVSVGEERTSKQIQPQNVGVSSIQDFIPINQVPLTLNFGIASSSDIIVLSEYYASQGDTRLKDILDSRVQNLITNSNFSLDELIEQFNYDPEDIVAQAQEELNAEQS